MDLDEIYHFWFGTYEASTQYLDERLKIWFLKDTSMDKVISEKFSSYLNHYRRNPLKDFGKDPRSQLALIILLDQIPRNIYRNTSKAHEFDGDALLISKDLIRKGWDKYLTGIEKIFLYLPFQHSESLEDQVISDTMFSKLDENVLFPFEKLFKIGAIKSKLHLLAIEKFHRFPHRNSYLNRESTKEERDFLQNPEHHF